MSLTLSDASQGPSAARLKDWKDKGMIRTDDLKNLVIIPVLKAMRKAIPNNENVNSNSAVNLLLGTCAVESNMGYFLKQIKGPAFGIYQIEPTTYEDIWENYLSSRPELISVILYNKGVVPDLLEIVGNLYLATFMARVHYMRFREPLPKPYDVRGMAEYWKTYYNTSKGKGTVQGFIANYRKYIENEI